MPPGILNTPENILDRLDATGPCWEWTGCISAAGYGQCTYRYKRYYVHRFVYEHLVGPIPEKFQLDHLCRNRRCANPDHLEPVTSWTNSKRGASWMPDPRTYPRKRSSV